MPATMPAKKRYIKLYTYEGLADPKDISDVKFSKRALAINTPNETRRVLSLLQTPAAVRVLEAAPIDSICDTAFQLARGVTAPPELRNTIIRDGWVFQKTVKGMRVMPLEVFKDVSDVTFMLLLGTSLCASRDPDTKAFARKIYYQLFVEKVGKLTRFDAAMQAAHGDTNV